jgi:hypothetical protein
MLRRRELSRELLNLDAYEKWGAPRDTEENRRKMSAHDEAIQRAYRELTLEIETLVGRTWQEAPAAIEAWADAHITLLTEFIAAMGGGDDKRTERGVADKERTEWPKVRKGTRWFVCENVHYVHVDPERRHELLGV